MTVQHAPDGTARTRSFIDVRAMPPRRRPTFGSPEVARYGALGLEDEADIVVPQSVPASAGEVELDPEAAVPLLAPLAHHAVDGWHLWIAVHEGKILVADDRDDAMLRSFIEGRSPSEVALGLQDRDGLSYHDAWTATLALVGRLAAGGLVDGVPGYHAVKKVRPHVFARFHLTNRCQLECIHCYTSSGPSLPRDDELPVERWLQLIDDFADNGGEKALFTGGEALVYRGCTDVMRRARERGLEVTLFSNGVLIPRYLEEIKQTAHIVQISIDGPSAETHDAIRGKGQFAKAMKAVHMLLEAGVETRISTTVMTNNWPAIERDFPRLVDEFKDTDLAFRVSYGAMAHGRGVNLDHNLDLAAVRRFVDGLLTKVKTTENREEGCNVVQKISGCGYAEQLVVAPDGMIYPCHLMSGALGHIDDLPLNGITRYLKRTSDAFGVDHRQGCGTCDLRHLCGGTCRVEDEKRTGSRLITTCTPDDKLRKKRFLVRRYRPSGQPAA